MFDNGIFDIRPLATPQAVVRGPQYRFTVLTDRLIRMEWEENGQFEDRPTKMAICRKFPVPEFTVRESEGRLEIITGRLHLYYDKTPFSQGGLSIAIKGMIKHKCAKWHYGMPDIYIHGERINLHGTVSTLDSIDGPTELADGLLDRHGFVAIDDSGTCVLDENGWFVPADKPSGYVDTYFFGYLEDHRGCLRDFFKLSGASPMIPRWALGNWWSRYYKYTEKSYMELMDRFREKNIPLGVAVLDMDWHITAPPEQYGNGWTGHSWDRQLFPDPAGFLRKLHELGLHVTANLHPADGVRGFEDRYVPMAQAMGIPPESLEPVEFDASDPVFMRAYTEKTLAPLEEEGIDFWWIDWQQKGGASRDGYDPLWMLNHYLYLSNAKKGEYPLILSRYAGLGSHRYPLGFSGDTVMSWESLQFQPYFTNCASNVGYGWWSHDIGGHTRGVWDDELQVRWIQYGVFSPVFRLHSASNPFLLKEPWSFPRHVEEIVTDFMRLRHRLIPYLYTMVRRSHTEGAPLISPLYYDWPREMTNDKDFLNEYMFGTGLLVCPITSPADSRSGTGAVKAWIPPGLWYDLFTGRPYRGAKRLTLYRELSKYPVLAKAGAILPLTDGELTNGAPLPAELELLVFCGDSGEFALYEDDGKLEGTKSAVTHFKLTWGESAALEIFPAEGDISILPPERNYRVTLVGARTREAGTVTLTPDQGCSLTFDGVLASPDWMGDIEARLPRWQIENITKQKLFDAMRSAPDKLSFLGSAASIIDDHYIIGEITEIITSPY